MILIINKRVEMAELVGARLRFWSEGRGFKSHSQLLFLCAIHASASPIKKKDSEITSCRQGGPTGNGGTCMHGTMGVLLALSETIIFLCV